MFDFMVREERVFDFTELNPKAGEFDLPINASEAGEQSIRRETG